MLTKLTTILAKLETTPGVDAGPTMAANAVLAFEPDLTAVKIDYATAEVVRPYLGNPDQIPTGTEVSLKFSTYFAGAGAAGTAPAYGTLLRASGLAEVITAGTMVEYTPVSSGFETATLYVLKGNAIKHVLLNAVGTFTIECGAKKLPKFTWTFTGKLGPITDYGGALNPVFTNWKTPRPNIETYTNTLTLHGFSPKAADLSIDLGGKVEHAYFMNGDEIAITDRNPKGSLTTKTVGLATKDWFSIAQAATRGALAYQHGTTAGEILLIDAPKVQVTNPAYADVSGTLATKLELMLMPDAGNDEFKLTVK